MLTLASLRYRLKTTFTNLFLFFRFGITIQSNITVIHWNLSLLKKRDLDLHGSRLFTENRNNEHYNTARGLKKDLLILDKSIFEHQRELRPPVAVDSDDRAAVDAGLFERLLRIFIDVDLYTRRKQQICANLVRKLTEAEMLIRQINFLLDYFES